MQFIIESNWNNVDQASWDQLVARNLSSTVFQTFLWHQSWWEVFGQDHQLFLVQAKQGDKFCLIAPLMIVKVKTLRILKFIGTGHSDYTNFILDEERIEYLEELWKFLAQHQDQWDAMALDYIPESSLTVQHFKALCKANNFYTTDYSYLPCSSISVDKDPQVFKEILSKKSLLRPCHYFEKLPDYQVRHYQTYEDIKPYLQDFFQQHMERWQNKKPTSLFINQRNQSFYEHVLKNLSVSQAVVFTVIRSEEKNIAYHFGLSFGKKFIWYKPSFDISLAKHSPGLVLLKELFSFASDKGYGEFDFTCGTEFFKNRFANQRSRIVSFKVFKSKKDQWLSNLWDRFKR